MSTDTSVHHDEHHGHLDHADINRFGFWVYVMSDVLLFSTLFATFAVLSNSYGSGVGPEELFNIPLIFVSTMLLLVSSFTFGMAMLGANNKNMASMSKWLWITFALGAGFLILEIYEFQHLVSVGAGPGTSAFWSAFYGLVATHGIHVTVGLIWIVTMHFHFKRDGLSEDNMTRLWCLSLFWHFLDIVWICVFSFVYLGKVL